MIMGRNFNKRIRVFEAKEGSTCVKKKYKQWIMVEGLLVIYFLTCFSLIFTCNESSFFLVDIEY